MADDRPIIVVKKKGGHAAHHGGAWKVAYADFVTAMMAFFLVMWILGLNSESRKSIAAYFNDPTGMMKSHAGGNKPIGVGRINQPGKPSIMPTRGSSGNKANQEASSFQKIKSELEKKISNSKDLKKFLNNIEIVITNEGLRIELLENAQSLFFDSGSKNLKPATVHLLNMIGYELHKLPNTLIIEGHTDSEPYHGGIAGYSNWELSTERAQSARRAMVSELRGNQVQEVRGYADRKLRMPENPSHYSNRRISILVMHQAGSAAPPSVNVGPDTKGIQMNQPMDILNDNEDFGK